MVLTVGSWPEVVPLIVKAIMILMVGLRPAGDQLVHVGIGPDAIGEPDRASCVRTARAPASDHVQMPFVWADEVVVLIVDQRDATGSDGASKRDGSHVSVSFFGPSARTA